MSSFPINSSLLAIGGLATLVTAALLSNRNAGDASNNEDFVDTIVPSKVLSENLNQDNLDVKQDGQIKQEGLDGDSVEVLSIEWDQELANIGHLEQARIRINDVYEDLVDIKKPPRNTDDVENALRYIAEVLDGDTVNSDKTGKLLFKVLEEVRAVSVQMENEAIALGDSMDVMRDQVVRNMRNPPRKEVPRRSCKKSAFLKDKESVNENVLVSGKKRFTVTRVNEDSTRENVPRVIKVPHVVKSARTLSEISSVEEDRARITKKNRYVIDSIRETLKERRASSLPSKKRFTLTKEPEDGLLCSQLLKGAPNKFAVAIYEKMLLDEGNKKAPQ